MTIGANNIQDEHVDVNNLWKWPSEWDSRADVKGFAFTPDSSNIVPEFWKWVGSIAYSGYGMYNELNRKGTFTYNSMTTSGPNGYSMGLFMDLEPGKYSIAADVKRIGEYEGSYVQFWYANYRQLSTGYYCYSGYPDYGVTNYEAAEELHLASTFTVKPGCCITIGIKPNDSNTDVIEVKNIVIKYAK